MSRRGQHGAGALALLLVLVACGASTSSGSDGPAGRVVAPAIDVAGLRGRTVDLVVDDVVKEAADPIAMADALTAAGFLAGSDRTLTGGSGTFSRVVLREWLFASEAGAEAFQRWVTTNAGALIGEAVPVTPSMTGLALSVHEPTGCCHEEVPVYLGTWWDGATVWTVRASGRRIHTAPVLALIRSIKKET